VEVETGELDDVVVDRDVDVEVCVGDWSDVDELVLATIALFVESVELLVTLLLTDDETGVSLYI